MSQKQLRKLRELRKAPEDPPENQQDGGQWAQGRRLESREMDLGSGGIRVFLWIFWLANLAMRHNRGVLVTKGVLTLLPTFPCWVKDPSVE